MYLDITIKQLPQGVIHFFLRRLFFISLIEPVGSSSCVDSTQSELLNRRYGSAILSPSHVVTDEECNNQ